MHFSFTLLALLALFFSGCSNAAGQSELPNQVPIKAKTTDNVTYIQNWSFVEKKAAHIGKILKPDNAAFDGALLWYGPIETQDYKKAALSALKAEGFTKPKIVSTHETNVDFLRQIDGHPEARAYMLVIDGRLAGKPARASVYTWFGNALDASGKTTTTHVFMAPSPIYEALGGIAVNSVYNLDATVAESTNMLEIGRLSPDESTAKMAELFNSWAVTYIQTNIAIMQMMGQTMAINQQTLNSMQSYNNALSQCGGWDCSISQGGDGLWTATPD